MKTRDSIVFPTTEPLIAIQLARLSGFSPIIATASLQHESHLKSLGATHVLDRNSDVRAEVSGIAKGTPIYITYDAISSEQTQGQALDVLAPGGQAVLVLPAVVDREKYKDKFIIQAFGNVHVPQVRPLGVSLYEKLATLLRDGSIKVHSVFSIVSRSLY